MSISKLKDKYGSELAEFPFKMETRRAGLFMVTYTPISFRKRLMSMLGFSSPGPTLAEIETGGMINNVDLYRNKLLNGVVTERAVVSMLPGHGMARLIYDPSTESSWEVRWQIYALDN